MGLRTILLRDAAWVGCLALLCTLPAIFISGHADSVSAIFALSGISFVLGAAYLPINLYQLVAAPIGLWTGNSLTEEMCCTQSQAGHYEWIFGLIAGAPIAVFLMVVAMQYVLLRRATPFFTFAISASLYLAWAFQLVRADAYAMNTLCEKFCG